MTMRILPNEIKAASIGSRARFPWEEELRNSGIDVTLMVPCLNEEKNVGLTLENIRVAMSQLNFAYEVIVIDDGSTDLTADKVREYQAQHPEMPIYLFQNEKNRGLARNFVDGAFMARGWYYRMVCGDAVEPPETIVNVLRHAGEADIIIPYMEQPKDRTVSRRFLSQLFVKVVNLCSGYKLRYYNGLPVYRTFDLLRMHTQGRGFGFQAETITRMLDDGLSYREVKAVSNERATGESKALTLHNWLSTGYAVFRILMNRIRRFFFS